MSTSINYLKNLHSLFISELSLYCHEDVTFPKGFDGGPNEKVINGIKLLQQKLQIIYSKKLKQQSSELFKRKIAEADVMSEYTDVENVMTQIDRDVPMFLEDLEEQFGPTDWIVVSPEKTSTAAQK